MTFYRSQFMQLLIVSLVAYILNSAYYIFGSSNESVYNISSWFLAILYAYLSGLIIYNVVVNVKSLQAQASTIDDPSMHEIRAGLTKKIVMFLLFAVVMVAYYLFHIAFLVVVPMLGITDKEYEKFSGVHAVGCMVAIACVTTIFHPCFFTASFQLGQLRLVFLYFKTIIW